MIPKFIATTLPTRLSLPVALTVSAALSAGCNRPSRPDALLVAHTHRDPSITRSLDFQMTSPLYRRVYRAGPALLSLPQDQQGVNGQRFTVALGATGERVLNLDSAETDEGGTTIWVGRVDGALESGFIITATQGSLAGRIWMGDTVLLLEPVGDNLQVIRPQRRFPAEASPRVPPSSRSRGGPPIPSPDARGAGPGRMGCPPETVDVLVAYVPAAAGAAGAAGIASRAALAMKETNQALAGSGVPHRIRVSVSPVQASSPGSGDLGSDLSRLQNPNDGWYDEVPRERDAVGADLVSLWVEKGAFEGSDACGLGYLISEPLGKPDFAFSVVVADCATGYYSFGHELGHTLGAEHDRSASRSTPATPYAYGYVDAQRRFRDIMATPCGDDCQRVKYYSTPTRFFEGRPLGIAATADPSHAADVAATITRTGCVASQYRRRTARGLP